MRILFFNNDYWPSLGGVEVLTRNLALGLRDRGHDVAVAANLWRSNMPAVEIVEGIEIRRFTFNDAIAEPSGAVMARVLADVTAFKRTFRPDVVQANVPGTAQVFHLHSLAPGEVGVAAFHCALDGWPGMWQLARNIAARSAAIIVPSNFLAGNIGEVLARPVKELEVIGHGIAAEQLLSIPPLPEIPPKRFLFAARLVALKGPDVAAEAIRLLAERGIAAELQMAGSGPLAGTLAETAARPELAGRIVLLGQVPQDELARRIADAAAQVAPSRSKESFSLVSAEAAFAARPVLASRRGALAETVVDGETGLLFEPGDPASLADAMQRLLQEPGLAARLGNAGRKRARSRYRLTDMIDRYEALYLDLIERSVTRPV